MEKGRVQVIVHGFVQGVFFRASTREMAQRYSLTGWVRNVPDGTVEAVFEGPAEQLRNAVEWCRQGPRGARVTRVEEHWLDYTGEFSGFDVRYSW